MNEPTPMATPEPQPPEADRDSNASSTPEIRDVAAAESTPAPAPNLPSPGTQLRHAREVAGQHVGVLAAMLKVPIAKIEALEADNYAALPDMVFARALAASVCRALKTDPAPIMAAFPAAAAPHIHADSGRINTPLQNSEQPHLGRSNDASPASRYLLYVVAFLLLAAAALFLAPYVLNGISTSRQPGQPASTNNATPQADTPGMTSFPVTTTILAPPDATAEEDATPSPVNDAPAAETPSASAETPAAATAMPAPAPRPANAATQTTPAANPQAGASASNNRPAPPARPVTPATQPARQP